MIRLLLVIACLTSQVVCQQNWVRWKRDDEWSPWRPPWENYDNTVVVRTLYGDVSGFTVPWHTDDLDWDPAWEEHPPWFTRRINCFLGVPYAAAPVGDYRFKRPEKPRWGGLSWDATYFRPACPQKVDEIRLDIPDFPSANVSEDCLYMNIFAPNLTYYRGLNQQYPVLVWFHSGDFQSGTAQTEPGHVLATKEIVVVTFNYRLGALGFMSLQDEHCAGNWGLYDMHMALEFVKENIKAFQGDPDRITIGGETAGAAGVGYMLLSEMTRAKGFYHQCIMMSGTDLSRSAFLNPYWQPRNYALELGARLGCNTDDTYRMMTCMRDNATVTWQEILQAQHSVKPRDGDLGVVWAPTQDGGWYQEDPNFPQVPFLRTMPEDIRIRKAFEQVPCLIGINSQDGVKKANESQPNLHRGMYREELQDFIRQLLKDWNVQDVYLDRVVEAVEFQYTYWPDPENRTARQQEFINLMTDLEVGIAMDRALKSATEFEPQWMYQFNYNSWNNWLPDWMGVGFSQAVPYVFGVPFMNETVLNETELEPRQFYDYEDRNMSEWMMYMWTNFMREGHPTPNITRNLTWEPFNFYNLSYLVIDHHSNIWGRYRQEKYSFWDEYLPEIAKQEFYYATPTPQGYEYVVATGFMSAIVIVLLCCLLFIIFAMWYQRKEERINEEYPATQMPMDFMQLSKMYQSQSASTVTRKTHSVSYDYSRQIPYNKTRTASSGCSDDEFVVEPQLRGPKPKWPPNLQQVEPDWSQTAKPSITASDWPPPALQYQWYSQGASNRQIPYRHNIGQPSQSHSVV